MIDHVTDPAGKFAFEFWYLDQDTNEAKEDPIDGYELELQELNVKKSAELLPILILGGVVLIGIGLTALCIYNNLDKEKKINKEIETERE